MIFNRLAIGTANWGKEYNGAKVSEDDQKRILDYCQCSGIDMIDTATSYEWDWTKVSSYFNVVVKVQKGDNIKEIWDSGAYCVIAHNTKSYRGLVDGISVYEPINLKRFVTIPNIIQAPYSIYDRRFGRYFAEWKSDDVEIHVRSVFLRGRLLERFKPWECITFCLLNPYVDRVIIGVDSYEQLKEDLDIFHRMNSAEIHDENILDPRKWEGAK